MPAPKMTAVVFDLDGTLVDNRRFHLLAWQQMAAERSIGLSAERFDAEIAALDAELGSH